MLTEFKDFTRPARCGVIEVTRSTRTSLRSELAQGRLRSTRTSLPPHSAKSRRMGTPVLRSGLAQGRLRSTRPLGGGPKSGTLDVDQSRYVEDPKEAVVNKERVLVEVVENDEDQDGERPGDAVDLSAAPEGP